VCHWLWPSQKYQYYDFCLFHWSAQFFTCRNLEKKVKAPHKMLLEQHKNRHKHVLSRIFVHVCLQPYLHARLDLHACTLFAHTVIWAMIFDSHGRIGYRCCRFTLLILLFVIDWCRETASEGWNSSLRERQRSWNIWKKLESLISFTKFTSTCVIRGHSNNTWHFKGGSRQFHQITKG